MDKYLYWLDRVNGLGPVTKRNLIDAFGEAKNIFQASERHLKYILNDKKLQLFMDAKMQVEIDTAFEELQSKKIHMICFHEEQYPKKLIHIPDPPFALYYKGQLPAERLPAVAVIGARECSSYGEYIASELGKVLGQQGIQVISGMAKGIDGISQSAALEVGGISFGVLGCGVDVCYPASNRLLYEELQLKGGILSAYPPGTTPQARLFPPRNRIVSGLADVLVVIEARQRSGTSITVEMALEQGREIYAVPGRVTDRLSDGCNKMIKEGAHVFLSPEDFMMDLGALLPVQMDNLRKQQLNIGGINDTKLTEKEDMTLSVAEDRSEADSISERIFQVLDFYPQSIEEIVEKLVKTYKLQVKQEEISALLMRLCLMGKIKQDSSSWFSKKQ